MEHTPEFVSGVKKMLREDAQNAGIEWSEKVNRVAMRLIEKLANSYQIDMAFEEYLFFKQVEASVK